MAYNRVDVDNNFVYKNYTVIPQDLNPSQSGYQYIRFLIKENGDHYIAMVEFRNGKWIALNDPTQEHRDLIDAVKKSINVYLTCQKELEEFEREQDMLLVKE